MTADMTHRQEVELPLFLGMTELLPLLLLQPVTMALAYRNETSLQYTKTQKQIVSEILIHMDNENDF